MVPNVDNTSRELNPLSVGSFVALCPSLCDGRPGSTAGRHRSVFPNQKEPLNTRWGRLDAGTYTLRGSYRGDARYVCSCPCDFNERCINIRCVVITPQLCNLCRTRFVVFNISYQRVN